MARDDRKEIGLGIDMSNRLLGGYNNVTNRDSSRSSSSIGKNTGRGRIKTNVIISGHVVLNDCTCGYEIFDLDRGNKMCITTKDALIMAYKNQLDNVKVIKTKCGNLEIVGRDNRPLVGLDRTPIGCESYRVMVMTGDIDIERVRYNESFNRLIQTNINTKFKKDYTDLSGYSLKKELTLHKLRISNCEIDPLRILKGARFTSRLYEIHAIDFYSYTESAIIIIRSVYDNSYYKFKVIDIKPTEMTLDRLIKIVYAKIITLDRGRGNVDTCMVFIDSNPYMMVKYNKGLVRNSKGA